MMEMKMTQFAPTRSHAFQKVHSKHRVQSAFGGALGAPLRWAQQAWTRHRDERLLQGLSDTQLRDLGITRGEIYRTVRDGLDR
jgi:uncharacterized protein YjiS (DUF1127 family)